MKTLKIIFLVFAVTASLTTCKKNNDNDPATSTQTWDLTFTSGTTVQVVEVVVTPFTNSGTFSETSDSQGLWVYDVDGSPCFRMDVGGNIVHDSPGDRWSFVNMGGSGCGFQMLATNSSGTANGNFPDADYISNGVVSFSVQSPMGTHTATATWTAVKK